MVFYRNIFLFLCLTITANLSTAQNYDAAKDNLKVNNPTSENRAVARDLHRALTNGLKKDFNIHSQSIVTLSSEVAVGESKTVEAMETYIYTDVKIEFQLNNSVTEKIAAWDYSGKGKGTDKYKSLSDAIKKFRSSKEGLKKLKEFISVYINEELKNNCDSFISSAKSAVNEDQLNRALLILNNLNDSLACQDAKKTLVQKITDQQAKNICDHQMQKIKVMVNSKQPQQLDQAVRQLLLIPPNAPCAEEALQVSEEIGKHLSEKQSRTHELLVKYQQVVNENLAEEWFQYFIQSKLNK
ncbi:MAG: hypothetical protein AAFZ15_21770 [Bacteroidota bacterium]